MIFSFVNSTKTANLCVCLFLTQQELKHFQVKIDKHNHWIEEKKKIGAKLREGDHHLKDKHQFVSDKVDNHGRVVSIFVLQICK